MGGMRCLVWGVYCLGLAISLFCLGLANPGYTSFGGGVAKYAKYRVLGQKWGFGSKMGFWVKNGVLGGGYSQKGVKTAIWGGGIAK
jgi:hypothetical protein